jgi:hypothetical protein
MNDMTSIKPRRRSVVRGVMAAGVVAVALFAAAPVADAAMLSRPQPKPPKGATAQCKDGTYSLAKSRQTACWGHRGVSRWMR